MAKQKNKKKTEESSSIRPNEFVSAIQQIAEEKGISDGKVIETIEASLAAAYKKDYGKKGQNIRSEFNRKDGTAKFFLVKEVVDETTREFVDKEESIKNQEESKKAEGKKEEKKKKEIKVTEVSESEVEKLSRFNPERDIMLNEAKKIKKGAKAGNIIETELEPKMNFGRVAAQTAKQVIIQRIREAERDSMFKEYKEKEGQVIGGSVQRIEGRTVFIDLGKSIGVLFPSEQIRGENYRIGQRFKVYVMKVESDPKGPGITLSRTHPEMVKKLFELEVPEIFSGTVEVKSIAREAGFRTKIAVTSKEKGVDPIGSCVGQKGTRVQAVIDELGGEKIDIIEWNEYPGKFIGASLSPAKVLSAEVNEETREAEVIVPDEQLSLAIGKQGQNVRLAAKLTGWKINVSGLPREISVEAENSEGAISPGEENKEEKKENKSKEKSEDAKKDKKEKEEKEPVDAKAMAGEEEKKEENKTEAIE